MKITNTEVYGLEFAERVSGFPMRTEFENLEPKEKLEKRMITLGNAKGGSGHDCALKGILVNFELEYDMFWTPQLQRYHFIDFVSSSSSMHKAKLGVKFNSRVDERSIAVANEYIAKYNENPNEDTLEDMLSNISQGQLKYAGMTTNYLQLKSIYNQRWNHKTIAWKKFCAWCESLPKFVDYCLGGERKFTNKSGMPINKKYYWNYEKENNYGN